MLSKDDKRKGAIMVAIRCGWTDDDILDEFHLTIGTLKAVKAEYEMIEAQLGEMRTVSEIAEGLKCSEEFVENVKHLIETDEETLVKEAQEVQEPEEQGEKQPKGKKGAGKVKDVDKHLKRTGEEQAASVLVSDAGDISRDVATKRQEIGRYVMEEMGAVAMQYGYSDHKTFLQMIYEFWLNNSGTIQEKDGQIAELLVVNEQLQAELDRDILRVFVAKSLDRVVIAAMMGGGTLDPDTLQAYKRVLETINPAAIIQTGGEVYA